MGKLEGKIALLTVVPPGIGLATSKLFQQEGAQVIVTGRSTGSLADAQKELAVQSDTSKLDDIDALDGDDKSKVWTN